MFDSHQLTSTRPYLLRALYEWCADNALTPYVAAYVDDSVQVPREYVKNSEIVLNISMDATSDLQIGQDFLQFKARFGGKAREISVPIDHIVAIYARENGQGMAFPVPHAAPPRGQVKESGLGLGRSVSGLRSVALQKTPVASSPLSPAHEGVGQVGLEESVKNAHLKAALPTRAKKDLGQDLSEPKRVPSDALESGEKKPLRPALRRIK
jgi:stringent starvation protein B